MREKVLISWSGGKDSAFALYEIIKTKQYEVAALLTTVTRDYDRISMHGVRTSLLEQQALSLGICLEKVFITKDAANGDYEAQMKNTLLNYKKNGVESVVVGDIFLEDLRRYREDKLSEAGLKAIFPLWGKDTKKLADSFINYGFKAALSCVDTKRLDKKFTGRLFSKGLVSELPEGVDHCGENGEFHSFVFDGPIFKEPVAFVKGEIVLRDDRFCYCDFLPL
ncbi:MAG: diphthine--ammonia ligase [Candidatus Omnitrophota bacterium]